MTFVFFKRPNNWCDVEEVDLKKFSLENRIQWKFWSNFIFQYGMTICYNSLIVFSVLGSSVCLKCALHLLPADTLTVVLGLFQMPVLPWGYPSYPSWDWPLLKCCYKHTVLGNSSVLTLTSYILALTLFIRFWFPEDRGLVLFIIWFSLVPMHWRNKWSWKRLGDGKMGSWEKTGF